jgi:hypothetical protein
METNTNPFEPRPDVAEGPLNAAFPSLLTVNQASDYLRSKNLPRSKKTIRKWCRLNHVDKSENTIPGGPKWLITKPSLDAKIAEERLIDASLKQETGTNPSEPVRTQTTANPSEPVRSNELVDVLKDQLAHERRMRSSAEKKNETLLNMYHEISMTAGQAGIEIGRGMAEQARARQLNTDGRPVVEAPPSVNDPSHGLDLSVTPINNYNDPMPTSGEDGDKPDGEFSG